MRHLTGESHDLLRHLTNYMPFYLEALQVWLCRESLVTGKHYRGSSKKRVTRKYDFTL